MIKTNSIYTLNKKDPNAIVYPTADGKLVRVTREDFPSEEAFLAFKLGRTRTSMRKKSSITEKPTMSFRWTSFSKRLLLSLLMMSSWTECRNGQNAIEPQLIWS